MSVPVYHGLSSLGSPHVGRIVGIFLRDTELQVVIYGKSLDKDN